MTTERLNCIAIVPAGGSGSRFGAGMPKQYLELVGKSVLEHALLALSSVTAIQQIFLVAQADDVHAQKIVTRASLDRVELLTRAGATRADTVINALDAVRTRVARDARVLVHDAARPCVTVDAIERLLRETANSPAGGLLALPVSDTIKRSDANGEYLETISRDGLWRAQTPQLFPYETLVHALRSSPDVTDEAQAIEVLGLKPKLVLGEARNIKITYSEDLALAEFFLRHV